MALLASALMAVTSVSGAVVAASVIDFVFVFEDAAAAAPVAADPVAASAAAAVAARVAVAATAAATWAAVVECRVAMAAVALMVSVVARVAAVIAAAAADAAETAAARLRFFLMTDMAAARVGVRRWRRRLDSLFLLLSVPRGSHAGLSPLRSFAAVVPGVHHMPILSHIDVW